MIIFLYYINYNKHQIYVCKGMRICLLPGASDLAHFKESLTSSTFVIQVHKEDIHKRAFHDRNKEEYVKIRYLIFKFYAY